MASQLVYLRQEPSENSASVVLLAFGEGKAEAVEETCEGGVSAFCPASALQLHPHATIIVDEAAASRLRHKDYYKYAFEHKPAWQGI